MLNEIALSIEATTTTAQVTFAIDPTTIDEDQTAAAIAARLVSMGGTMLTYTRALGGAPAKARLEFESEAARDRVALKALKIPGVSLVPE